MGNDIANIQIGKDVIEPIVRAQLQASIGVALGKSDELIAGVVHTLLNMKVDRDGKECSYGSAKPFITWMCEEAIKGAAKDALHEWFEENRALVKEQVKKAITRNTKTMAEQFVLGMTNAANKYYQPVINIQFKDRQE